MDASPQEKIRPPLGLEARQRSVFTSLCIAGGAQWGELVFAGRSNKPPLKFRHHSLEESKSTLPYIEEIPIKNSVGELQATLILKRREPFFQEHLNILNYLLTQDHIDLKTPLLSPHVAQATVPSPRFEDQLDFMKGLNDVFMTSLTDYSNTACTHSVGVGKLFDVYMDTIAQDPGAFQDTPLAGLSKQQNDMFMLLGFLHDLGKLYIPREILEAPGILTEDQRKAMRLHPHISTQILTLADPEHRFDILSFTAGAHHMFDGMKTYDTAIKESHESARETRYRRIPYPFYGNENNPRLRTPMESKILAVCDKFEAMTSIRPYQGAGENTRTQRTPSKALVSLLKDANDGEVNPLALHYFLEHKIYHAIPSDAESQAEVDSTARQILRGAYCDPKNEADNISRAFLEKVEEAKTRLPNERFAVQEMRDGKPAVSRS